MVSRSLSTPEAGGKHLDVHGPQAFTIPEALQIYCDRVATGTRVVTMPLWFMTILDRTVLHGELRGTLGLMRAIQESGERGDPTEANRLLGAPSITLAEWCERRTP
jgi:hypothetical protein